MARKYPEHIRKKLPEKKKKKSSLQGASKRVLNQKEKEIFNDYHLNPDHPGVSGKNGEEGIWINGPVYEMQKEFIGDKSKNFNTRSDDRIYQEVSLALKASSINDTEDIGIFVDHGVVYLQGKVQSKKEKKQAEICVKDLPGVKGLCNELRIEKSVKGPDVATKKDLGIENFNDYK
ncbi:MAG: BON domain-containing protein [Candidatus Babeliales bacterium]